MKIFIIMLILYGVQGGFANIPLESSEDKINDFMISCLTENGLSPGTIDGVNLPNNMMTLPTREKMNCYIICMYKKLGVLLSDEDISGWAAEAQKQCVT